MLQSIIKLRHELHKNPEISNQEFQTSEKIFNFIKKFNPDKLIKLGKTGLAFVFNGKKEGKTLMFRAELDALPINEKTLLTYTSVNKSVAHSCGHDGHMSILTGLAQKISTNRPQKGRVVLLFQPAEEVEQGARDIIENPKFKDIEPDYIFALHNIPGVEKYKIILKNGCFSAASKGMTIELIGETSHAAEPEKGVNPAVAISEIIRDFKTLISNKKQFNDLTLLTFIFIRMGEISFGTSVGHAEIGLTLRAFENDDMVLLTQQLENKLETICEKENLKFNVTYNEVFPATENDKYCVSLIEQSAKDNNYSIVYIDKPFKWSEDFGYYTGKYKGAFLGLGAGLYHPALHNDNYDFPDEIIETGVNVFYEIFKEINF